MFGGRSGSNSPAAYGMRAVDRVLSQLDASRSTDLRLFALLTLFYALVSVFKLCSVSSDGVRRQEGRVTVQGIVKTSTNAVIGVFFVRCLAVTLVTGLLTLPLT